MASRSSDEGPFEHLHPDIAHLATGDRAIRRAAILTDRWVSYPAAEDAVERMFGILAMPSRLRMPSVLFWAVPNMGKSSIQVHFLSLVRARYPSESEPEEKDKPWRAEGVLRIEVNDELTEKRFYCTDPPDRQSDQDDDPRRDSAIKIRLRYIIGNNILHDRPWV
ncbi:TniB family NTP-binding protein [Caulobacter segnis]|uniref:TniB family NTP-binding protein n=1 Tax=Caulobacter segnis TaxID=88688 RepID=UPI002865C1FF|nr:TniB family NTP-binding protein [Caulobacter segnis]MDR6625598.1 hypothetical protein [Caulobacter segnis]